MGFLALAVALVAGVWHFSPWFRTWSLGKVDQARGAAIHYDLLDQVEARNIRQVMTADPSRNRVIQWQSDYPVKEPVLEYRKAGESSLTAASVTEEKFTDGGKDAWIYTARLEQLEPGQAYEYRIRAGKKATEWMPLKAFAGNTFKALIFPDSQSADYSVWKATAQPAWQRNPDASFFVNMGDLVDNGEDNSQWNAWFGVVEPMAEKIPVAPLMGNHETYDLNWKVRMPEGYLHRFALPDNGREKYRNQFYSFTVGSISGQWDYIEPVLFGYAAGAVIASYVENFCTATDKIAAHFHEWMTAAGGLYLRRHAPYVATLFTTHATVTSK